MSKMQNKGFTLIELIVVMAIIAVLVLLAAPRFLGYTEDGNTTAIQQDLRVLSDATELYRLDSNDWPVDTDNEIRTGIGGLDTAYVIDENKLSSNIKNIYGDFKDYAIITKGDNLGEIIHIENNQITFNGKNYHSVLDVPTSPASMFKTIPSGTGGCIITGFDEDYIQKHLNDKKINGINIPNKINNLPVVAIGRSAFESKGLDYVRLDDAQSLEKLEVRAFMRNNIKEVLLPDSVTTIESMAFKENNITKLTIPSNIEFIGQESFMRNQIQDLNIVRGGEVRIQGGAFSYNQLPNHQAFVYKRNPDGSSDKTTIASYGGAERDFVKIPDGVVTISGIAFYGNDINKIHIPDTVKSIGYAAFRANHLKEVRLPNSIEVLSRGAFDVNLLETVTFEGNVRTVNSEAFLHNGPSGRSTGILNGQMGTWRMVNNAWIKQ